jgi:hypothetical protein
MSGEKKGKGPVLSDEGRALFLSADLVAGTLEPPLEGLHGHAGGADGQRGVSPWGDAPAETVA